MKHIFSTLSLFCLTLTLLSQTAPSKTKEDKSSNLKLVKHENFETIHKKNIEITKQKEESKKEYANPLDRNSSNSSNTIKKTTYPITATKMNQPTLKNSVNFSIDASKSTLENLLDLIEEKRNIHESGNNALLNSPDFTTLNKNITSLKSDFNKEVDKKGLTNCSSQEQSLYLSFLKEEGKETEYNSAINQIK